MHGAEYILFVPCHAGHDARDALHAELPRREPPAKKADLTAGKDD